MVLSWLFVVFLVVMFYASISQLIFVICSRYYPDSKIHGEARKSPNIPASKIALYFIVNTTVIATMAFLAFQWTYLPSSNLYLQGAGSFLDVFVILGQFLLIMVIKDANFYFFHRLMHENKFLYKTFHADHHLARYPNVWHLHFQNPLDFFLTTASPVLWISFLPIPISIEAYLLAFIVAGFTNIGGHAGYEITHTWVGSFTVNGLVARIDPRREWLSRWFGNVLHHDLHHFKFSKNYALYFTWWDRLLGSYDPKTDDDIHHFLEVTEGQDRALNEKPQT
jgi:sterol desaturase/sphingolipid hydroxylase (fatty acid hydroxylase superfamily)